MAAFRPCEFRIVLLHSSESGHHNSSAVITIHLFPRHLGEEQVVLPALKPTVRWYTAPKPARPKLRRDPALAGRKRIRYRIPAVPR